MTRAERIRSIPSQAKLTNVHEHHWQTINPVTTEALVQLTLGAPQLMYNGGLLHSYAALFRSGAEAARPPAGCGGAW